MSLHRRARIRTVDADIDGREVTVAGGHDDLAGGQGRRHRHPRAVPRRALRPGRRVPDVRGRRRRAASTPRPACAPCEDGMEVTTATPELERSRAMLTELLLADQPPREHDPKQTTTGDNELLVLVRQLRREPATARPAAAARAAASTCPTRSSRSTTTPASCATAACAPATTSRATTSSAAAARATRPGSPST